MLITLLAAALADDDTEARNARLVQRKPRATSMLLHDMMADADAEQTLQLRYWMARSFERIELYHAAQRYYLAAIAGGESRWRGEALVALVRLTDRIGDDADLVAAVSDLSETDFPAEVASSLRYLQGVGRHEAGDLPGAITAYAAVPYGTPRYFSARLRLAVVQAESGARGAARDTLLDLLRTQPFGTRIQQQEAEQVQSLALLDLARLYYAAGDAASAEALYAQVDGRSRWRSRADLEGGWASLLTGDIAAAGAGGEAAAATAYLPEGHLLAASAALQSSGCPAALPRLEAFLTTHRPMADELDRTGRMSGADLWDWWFGASTTAERALPVRFYARLLHDQPLAGAIYRMDRIEREIATATDQSPDWVSTVGEGVISLLEGDLETVTERMHTRLEERAALLQGELSDLIDEAEAMKSACEAR